MAGDLLVRGGRVVWPWGVAEADVLIREGVVEAVGRGLRAGDAEVLDARGLLVFPGVVDEHVHMREPGLTEKEDFSSGTMAAAAGGVTTVLEMPNTVPPVDSVKRLREKRALLEGKAYVDFGLYGVLNDSNLGELEEMWHEGAVGFKVFMGPTTGNIPPPKEGALLEALELSARYGFVLAFHAENMELVKHFTEKVRGSGRSDALAHPDSRPNICEEEATSRILLYARRTGGRVHIVHMSACEAVDSLAEAKARGVKATGETCPQYLLLTREAHKRFGSLVKINPPLRGEKDVARMWEALRRGDMDVVASDHAPHTVEEKTRGIWEAASGFIGVETLFPLMLDSALRGRLRPEDLARLLARNPAKIFGLYPKKGEIGVGSDGDLVLVDPHAELVLNAEKLHSKHKLTPFNGMTLKGRIKYTVLGGEIIAHDGIVVGKPRGKFIKPVKRQ